MAGACAGWATGMTDMGNIGTGRSWVVGVAVDQPTGEGIEPSTVGVGDITSVARTSTAATSRSGTP